LAGFPCICETEIAAFVSDAKTELTDGEFQILQKDIEQDFGLTVFVESLTTGFSIHGGEKGFVLEQRQRLLEDSSILS